MTMSNVTATCYLGRSKIDHHREASELAWQANRRKKMPQSNYEWTHAFLPSIKVRVLVADKVQPGWTAGPKVAMPRFRICTNRHELQRVRVVNLWLLWLTVYDSIEWFARFVRDTDEYDLYNICHCEEKYCSRRCSTKNVFNYFMAKFCHF